MSTLRQKIAERLEKEALTLSEISRTFGMKENEALDHLQHIARSFRPSRLIAEPATCRECGFVFKKRERLSTPGRCPRCKSEHISAPLFHLQFR